jgi:hypothetical protein
MISIDQAGSGVRVLAGCTQGAASIKSGPAAGAEGGSVAGNPKRNSKFFDTCASVYAGRNLKCCAITDWFNNARTDGSIAPCRSVL